MKEKVLMGSLLLSCMLVSCSTRKEKDSDTVMRVQTETVTKDDNAASLCRYVGEVEAATSTAVSFTGSGTVLKVMVNEGQIVSKGQLIAEMDDTQNRNALQSAQAMMNQAQDAYDRMKVLHDRQSLSEMDWVEVQSKVQQAQSTLQMAQKALKDCRLVAPCSGVVGSKMLEAGMVALPAQPVCRILDISNVKVKISVPEKEISDIPAKASVIVDALDGEIFESKGMERGVTADAISRTYDVRYLVNNPDSRILPGMICTLVPKHQTVLQNDNSITVPITSIQRSADGTMFVWTVREGASHRAKVTTGKAAGNRIAILSGLSEGDVVVIKGYQKLYENCKVK